MWSLNSGIILHYEFSNFEPIEELCSGDNQITCPAHRCQAYVDDKLVFDLFSRPNNPDDAQVVRKFKKLVVDAFVSTHRLTIN